MTDILIVDDDPEILATLREILEANGYTVQTADSGTGAILLARDMPFEITLLDIKLPDMEGTDILREIRKIRPAMKCIMVTGFASLDNAIKSLNSGAAGYIMKPVNPENLLMTIKEKLQELEEDNKITSDKVADWATEQLLRLS
jgi:DNA-binding NtrC family response regulator